MAISHANPRQACDTILKIVRDSDLNFYVQETPFSAFITIRKTFFQGSSKGLNNPAVLEVNSDEHEKLKLENEALKNQVKEKDLQIEAYEKSSCLLQSRLEKAEKELLNHFQIKKIDEKKLGDEIIELKSVVSSLKAKGLEATRTIKTQAKDIHNLEKKNENLIEQVALLKASKNDLKNEKVNLLNEVKALKVKTQKKSKCSVTQTDPPVSCLCLDNNNSTAPVTVMSKPTETSSCPSDSAQAVANITSSQSIKCLICAETFRTAEDLVKHAGDDHDILIDAKKITDTNEDDSFLRFLKSMIIDQQYMEERVQYYPQNCDHIYERIKIRIIAQIKFLSHSRAIERNMQENNLNNYYRGRNEEI